MNDNCVKISLFIAALVCIASFASPAFAKGKMWKVYMIEAESSIQSGDYEKSGENVDKAIELLKGQNEPKALAEAYYLKSALIVQAETDPGLAEKYIWMAVKAAPMEPMPKKPYLADPRIAEYRESVLSFLAMEAEQIIQYSKDLLEKEEYCRAKRMLEKVMPFCGHNCMLAETMLEIASSDCTNPPAGTGVAAAPVAAGAAAVAASGAAASAPSAGASNAAPVVATTSAQAAPVAPAVAGATGVAALAGNKRIGVLPIHYSGVSPDNLKNGQNADWVQAIQGAFAGYKVEPITGLDLGKLKQENGLTSYSDFLVRGWQVKVSGSIVDSVLGDEDTAGVSFGGLSANLVKAMENIMLHGNYEYVVVSKLEATQSKGKNTFQINMYHSSELPESAATAYKRTTGKFMNRYYNGAAEILLEDINEED